MWDAFQQQLNQILPEIAPEILASIPGEQHPSIRFNASRPSSFEPVGLPVPWEKKALQLNESPAFYLDPNWHAGAYYVQESSSMFLGYLLRELIHRRTLNFTHQLRVLDLCAAPGGKSTHILDSIPEGSLLVSNEILSKRNAILRENLIRWGNPNIVITQNDADDFSALENYFDIAVIDAPCSGEGLFRKDKNTINEWSTGNVIMCANRQRGILQSTIHCIKENGFLIYSTCTFEPSENEEQVQWLLENGFELVPFDVRSFDEISEGSIPNTFRFYPNKTKGSGFFIACLKKVENGKLKMKNDPAKRKNRFNFHEIKLNAVENWIEKTADYSILQTPFAIHAFPKIWKDNLELLNQHLHITYFGTEIGELKKELFLPAHALALSDIIKKDFPSIEVDKENALKYLRKLSFSGNENTPGWHLVKYKGLNLGWVKILPDRINNYLPNNWRILH